MVGIAGIALLVATGAAYSVFTDRSDQEQQEQMDAFATGIQQELILASELHRGYEREIDLPQEVSGTDYSISIDNDALYVSYDDGEIYKPLPETTGSVSKGINTVRNDGGTVHVS